MRYPFKKNPSRILTIAMVLTLVMSLLTGCFGGNNNQQETDPLNPPKLNLNEPTEPTETEPPETTEPINENIAIVVTTTNVRSSPGTTSPVINTLDPGVEVEVLDRYGVFGVEWALIREGWVVMESLEMKYAPDDPTDPSGDDPSDPTESGSDATEPQQPSGNQNTGNGNMGVITASELNIRSEADQNSDKVGMYNYGDRVKILETKNGWGRTDKGWVSMSHVYLDGSTGTKTGKGIVTGTQLYIRSGPGTNYDAVGSVNKGDRVNILEQVKIGDMTWGCIEGGWISLSYVYMDGTTGEGSGTGTVTGDGLNIRSGPGTKYNSVGSLNKGDTVKIYTQIKFGDMTWGCIDGGWVSMSFVSMG